MMNWKGCGRERSWRNFRYCPDICLKGLRKITKTWVRIVGVLAEIWTRNLPTMKQLCQPISRDFLKRKFVFESLGIKPLSLPFKYTGSYRHDILFFFVKLWLLVHTVFVVVVVVVLAVALVMTVLMVTVVILIIVVLTTVLLVVIK
jgi:hypothetical protein